MAHSTNKARRSFWPFGIVVTGSFTYFLTLILVLYVLDRQIYTTKKLEIIRDNFYRIFDFSSFQSHMGQLSRNVLFATSPAERQLSEHELHGLMDQIVHGPSSMYRIELHDTNDVVTMSADASDKIRQMNTWQNNLFLRNFSGRTSQLVYRDQNNGNSERGFLVAYYTSPVDYAPIEQLTAHYRLLAALLVALWAAIYAFIYRNLFRPVRNVTAYLERSREAAPRLILRSHAHLETAYNQLATRALLQLLEERLSAPTRPDSSGESEERAVAVAAALRIAADAFSVSDLTACEISISHEQPASIDMVPAAGESTNISSADVSARLQKISGGTSISHLPEDGRFAFDTASNEFTYAASVAPGTCLLILGTLQAEAAGLPQRLDGLQRACAVLRRGFLAYRAYREGIFRQRSEANIVLSRNLGHDLTNIIATSKLDLMAVRRLLDATPAEAQQADPRRELLNQAVNGLLESTRFLQEIVNIYRSFSHVKRPQYERRELRGLILEFLSAFEPSISARIAVVHELDAPMPPPIVEPRLLKLALFNVLTNALDALRKNPADDREAKIVVRTAFAERDDSYQIQVEDNGPGIRDAGGRLLAPAELQAIFEYGYSTKSESSEGLGLSWVRTIMADFHDGGVTAQNLENGGARITLVLHSMERSEAKVG